MIMIAYDFSSLVRYTDNSVSVLEGRNGINSLITRP